MYVDTLWDFMIVTLFSILTLYIVGYSSIRLIGIASRKNLMNSANRILDLNSDGVLKFGFFAYLGIVFSLLLMEILVLLKTVNQYVILGFFTVFVVVFLCDVFRKGKNIFKKVKISSILSVIVLILILGLASFECWKIIGSQVGPIGDALYHTDVIQVVMKNQYFAAMPGLIFGAHSLVAFLTILLQVSITKSVLVFSSIFSVMIPIGFYCLAVTCIRSRLFGYICAFVGSFFWLDSMNPISWGSIYQPLAFFVILCALGFSKKLLFAKRESIYYVLLFSFLLFIPIWAIYPIPALILSFWLVLLFSFLLVRDRTSGIALALKSCMKQVLIIVMAALLAISSCFLFIYNQLSSVVDGAFITAVASDPKINFSSMSVFEFNHHLSIPFSVISSFPSYTDRLFGFYTERPGSFDIIPYGVIAAVFILLLLIVRRRFSKNHDFLVQTSKITLLFYLMSVMFFLYITFLDSYLFWLFPSVRVMEFEGIILVMLTGLGIALFWGIFKSAFLASFDFSKLRPEHLNRKYFAKLRTVENPKRKAYVLVGLVLALVVFSNLINVQAPLDSNATVVARNAAKNQVLTEDDVELQQWINANISKNSTILFSPIDGGFNLMYLTNGPQFVGSYGDWPVIQFSSQFLLVHNQSQTNEYFASYLRLLTYLSQTPDSSEALSLLRLFNVTYIYVGALQNLKLSNSLAGRVEAALGIENFTFTGFSAQLFNESIYYEFIKGVGNASLFKVDYDTIILKTWEDSTFINGWTSNWTSGENVAYSWRSGTLCSLTVGGGCVNNRGWIGKAIIPINLRDSNYLITSLSGTSNAKFLVQGLDANGTVLVGSSNWENAPDNQTLRSYQSNTGLVTFVLMGALSSDGKNATVNFNFIALCRKAG